MHVIKSTWLRLVVRGTPNLTDAVRAMERAARSAFLTWSVMVCTACGQAKPAAESLPAAIVNMPMNSESRCLGITLAVEAVADAQRNATAPAGDAATIAAVIYRGPAGQRMLLPAKLRVGADKVPLDSRIALAELSSLVAEMYQRDHAKLVASFDQHPDAAAARWSYVPSAAELRNRLRADRDGLLLLGGDGQRWFPDGTIKATTHAFLVRLAANHDSLEVFDPNEPGRAIPCTMRETETGVLLKWTCRYRDTEEITTQEYAVIDPRVFLAATPASGDDTQRKEATSQTQSPR